MDLFEAAFENFGLVINTENTVVVHQPPPDAAHVALQINVNDAQLQVVKKLYLQHPFPHHQNRRLGGPLDLQSQQNLRPSSRHSLESPRSPPHHQRQMYKAVILPTQLYGAKTWTIYKKHASTTNSSTISETDADTVDFTCPLCPRAFTSRIGLAGHLRIHRTETGEPVPGALTYTRRIRFNCLHCTRTFAHHMGQLGIQRKWELRVSILDPRGSSAA
nr:unnamed protein product [Spirometra erinaceieuropaei]